MKKLIRLLFALSFLGPVATVAAEFKEGTHYIEIPFSESLKTGNKVEVREFFWYGCGHCFKLEPLLMQWKKNLAGNVMFVTTPAFLPRREIHAKAYYAFEAMGKLPKLHGALFSALHVSKRKLETEAILADFVDEQGEDRKAFLKHFKSFAVDGKAKQATLLGTKYQINSVPTFVVDGRYSTDASMAGTQADMLRVVDYLVSKISKSK